MPVKYVPPRRFLIYKGCPIYHVYRNDNANDPMFYHYTTDRNEEDAFGFDVRDLVRRIKEENPDFLVSIAAVDANRSEHRRVIREAVRLGLVELPAEDEP